MEACLTYQIFKVWCRYINIYESKAFLKILMDIIVVKDVPKMYPRCSVVRSSQNSSFLELPVNNRKIGDLLVQAFLLP